MHLILKLNIAETNLEKLSGLYYERLNKLGLPNYLYLGEELVTIIGTEYRRAKGKGKSNKQCYYHTDDGRVKHASFFKKIDIKTFNREFKINQILYD